MKRAPTERFERDLQYYKFCAYGFLKDLRFFEPFLLLLFLDKGLSYLQVGSLYALREVLINIVEIPSGIMADAMGRRRTMIMSFMAYILSFGLFYFSDSYLTLLGAMGVFAFGDAFRTGTHKAMIFDYLKLKGWADQKTHYYGHTRSWSQRGAALSALIAAALVFVNGSYAPVFLFTIIPYVLDLLLMISYPATLDGPRHAARGALRDEFAHVIKSFISSFRNPAALRAIANQSLYTGYYKASKDYLQPMLKAFTLGLPLFMDYADKERSALVIGVVYFALYLGTSYAAKSSGRFADRFTGLARPLNGTLFTGIGLGLLSGAAYALGLPALSIVLYIGIYLLENLRKPMGIAYVSERMNQDALATALSAESQAETVFAAVIALALGFASDLWGPGLGIMAVSTLCLAAAWVLRLKEEPAGSLG
ncbi:MAG: MFS transporter [Clostridia bacterium]|jgi:MFS family permease